ncbi:MAG: patatin-like phospholipase family protein [Mangrovibacterium sp.]
MGVVLSGGGAKGVAHISVLKAIEEAGIPVDYIVGTSMGAIIGGLYAIGYSPGQLDSLVRSQDWEWLLSDKPRRTYQTLEQQEEEASYVISMPLTGKVTLKEPDALVKGQNIGDMFAVLTIGFHDSIDFKRLPVPFACIATNLTDGSEVIQDKGVLPEAMRASMAIPGVFSPVRKNGKVLVDGGLSNNFPVDVARGMGADIVIGVDVQEGSRDVGRLDGVSGILSQLIDNACKDKYEENLNRTDVYIKVNVKGYSASSFSKAAIDTLIHRGQLAADSCRKKLQEVRAQLSLQRETSPSSSPYLLFQKGILVKDIRFEGADDKDHKWVIRKCGLEENSSVSYGQIEQALAFRRRFKTIPVIGRN